MDGGRSAGEAVLNVAHRGASGRAPENTFAAYELALGNGADYIEQDVRMTADGTLVVLHDETLDRTASPTAESKPGDCTGLAHEKVLAQIKTCDVGSWFNETYPRYAKPEYVGLQIPTLEEVFRRYRDRANFYIDLKPSRRELRAQEELLRLMGRYGLRGPAAKDKVLVVSFSASDLRELHSLDPSLPLMRAYASAETPETIRASLEATLNYAVGVNPWKADVSPDLVRAAHDRCLLVHPYAADKRREMEGLIGLGVDGIFTKFPGRLDEVLGEKTIDSDQAARRAVAL